MYLAASLPLALLIASWTMATAAEAPPARVAVLIPPRSQLTQPAPPAAIDPRPHPTAGVGPAGGHAAVPPTSPPVAWAVLGADRWNSLTRVRRSYTAVCRG
jgi:hypothetical protein